MQYRDIPKFPTAHYQVDVTWDYLKSMLDGYAKDYDLDLSPDYQRAHVWTREQQIAYVEYCLMGGEVSRGGGAPHIHEKN
jgi:hypothetical protein